LGTETHAGFTLEGAHDGADLLAVDLNNMHLLNELTGGVL